MIVDELPLPPQLLSALEAGRWPRTPDEALGQNLESRVPLDRLQAFAPDEDRLYLYPPPFRTVSRLLATHEGDFWRRHGALESIVPELALVIGDFGLGSDAVIILDYRDDRTRPSVWRLRWMRPQANCWLRCARDFEELVRLFGWPAAR